MFAAAREAAECDAITVEVADPPRARDVLTAVGQQVPAIAPLLPSCRLAVDCAYVSNDDVISQHREVALIPPVSGG